MRNYQTFDASPLFIVHVDKSRQQSIKRGKFKQQDDRSDSLQFLKAETSLDQKHSLILVENPGRIKLFGASFKVSRKFKIQLTSKKITDSTHT